MKIANIDFYAKGWMEPITVAPEDIPKCAELELLNEYLDLQHMTTVFRQNRYPAQTSDLHISEAVLHLY